MKHDVPRQHIVKHWSAKGSASASAWRRLSWRPCADASGRAKSRPAPTPSIGSTAKPCSAKSRACRRTPQPRSSTCCAPRLQSGTSAATTGCGSSQLARPSGVAHRSSTPRPPSPPSAPPRPAVGCALPVIISAKRRCAGRQWSAPGPVRHSFRAVVAVSPGRCPTAAAVSEVAPAPSFARPSRSRAFNG